MTQLDNCRDTCRLSKWLHFSRTEIARATDIQGTECRLDQFSPSRALSALLNSVLIAGLRSRKLIIKNIKSTRTKWLMTRKLAISSWISINLIWFSGCLVRFLLHNVPITRPFCAAFRSSQQFWKTCFGNNFSTTIMLIKAMQEKRLINKPRIIQRPAIQIMMSGVRHC